MAYDFDVIIAGSYSADLIFSGLKELPRLGIDTVGTGFIMTPGEAYISAVAMHRLGIKVGWAADFGNDEFSQFALKCAREEGLDETLFVLHDRPYRRISAAASYPEDRMFITYYDPDPKVPAVISALIKYSARALFVPGLYIGALLSTGKKLVRLKGMKLVMDGNSSEGEMNGNSKQSKLIRKTIRSVDIFLPNAREAQRLTGVQNLETSASMLGKLCPLVVVKDGANGSIAALDNKTVRMSAITVNPMDTTGAGDNFNAGFLFAYLNGWSIEECLKCGNISGGLATTALGGTFPKITSDDLRRYLDSWQVG
jgi:sugar/nucleoside kinase (ribokinase family)